MAQKMNPEEMLQYTLDQKLDDRLKNAVTLNERGYEMVYCDGKIIEKNNTKYFSTELMDGPAEFILLQDRDSFETGKEYRAVIRCWQEKYMLIISNADTQEKREEEVRNMLFIDFFRCLDINNPVRLKSAIFKAEERMFQGK